MKTEIPIKSQIIKPKLINLKSIVSQYFGSRLKHFILYGSYARGNFNESSDIDILVVLDEVESEMKEIGVLADLKTDILLDSDIYISTNPVSLNKFNNSNFTYYQNIRREGVIV